MAGISTAKDNGEIPRAHSRMKGYNGIKYYEKFKEKRI